MTQRSRQKIRRGSERRVLEKRKIIHTFGSHEWIREVMKDYMMWPKEDQRSHDRRGQERRYLERRSQDRRTKDRPISRRTNNTFFRTLAKKRPSLLSYSEKQMLNKLISPR